MVGLLGTQEAQAAAGTAKVLAVLALQDKVSLEGMVLQPLPTQEEEEVALVKLAIMVLTHQQVDKGDQEEMVHGQ